MACQIQELVEYILANPDKTKSVWGQVNKIVNPSTSKNQKVGINISSKSSDVLGRALTNKTYKKYPIEDVPGLIKPSVNTQDGLSAEGWYKANQSRKIAPELDMKKAIEYDMDLMQRIIVAKFKQYPELVQQITAKGGKEFIENSEHTVGVAGSRWEGKGLDSNFIKVLAKAYEDLVSGKTSDKDTKVGLDDNNTTTLEEELTYLNSKKTIKGTLPQKGQKVEFQRGTWFVTGVIHQMLDGTRLGYENGNITELSSGKDITVKKPGGMKASFIEAITKLKTATGAQKANDERIIKEGTLNKDIPKSKVLKMAIDVRREYDARLDFKIAKKLKRLYAEIEVLYLNGQIEMSRVLDELSGGIAMFQLSSKRKKEFEIKLRKARPELDGVKINEVLKSIEEFSETEGKGNEKLTKKLELLALHWTLKGNVVLPEDGSKIMQALKISEREKFDPFSYSNPNEITEKFAKVKDKVKPLNPDEFLGKGYENKQEWSEGVVVYDVENSELGRSVSRKMIDTHFGDDANPWCLLAKDYDGSIQGSASYWFDMYPGEKKIAFINGKLVAFYGGNSWWDRMDNPSDGVVIESKENKDTNGRIPIHLKIINNTNVNDKGLVRYIKGNKTNGFYEEWEKHGTWEVKTIEEFYVNGQRTEFMDFYSNVKYSYNTHATDLGFNNDIIGDKRINYENDSVYFTAHLHNGYMLGIPERGGYWLTDIFGRSIELKKSEVKLITMDFKLEQIPRVAEFFSEEIEDIPFQKQDDTIKGAAIISKKKILIDIENRSTDTLAHEYAHFYIAAFRETPIVQEAIRKWGGEEALVQAIGEQVVKQKGEAYGWWKEFSSWLKGLFIGLDKASREDLVQLLTDAFLTRQDLDTRDQKADIIKSSKIKSKTVEKAVEARNTRIKKVAKNMWWKRYAAETKQVPGKYNDYYGAMEKTITKIVDPKVVTNVVGLMLEDVFNGKFQIVAGDYDPDTHTVQIAEKPRQMEIEMAVEEGLQEEAIRLYEDTTENMAYRAKLIEDYVNKNRANALAYVISSVESVNGGHTTTHELIHAGSVNFMRDPKNANHPAVLRVKELYKEALARESDIRTMTRTGDVYTEYWKKNEEEFISEALSNPQLMYALSNIKTVGKERLSKGLFAELVESLIKMLGLSKKTEDNLLEFTMDGFAAIMEAQAVELNRNSNVPAKIYHGFKGNITPYINKEGNLVMKPSKNFGGKTTSVSFTHSLDTAYRYAAQVKGEGPLGYDFINAKVFEIETKYIDELLQRESQEEWAINTDKDVVIPKRAFKVIEHPLTSRLGEVEKEYPFKEFVRDVTMDHEFDGYGDERSYGNYFEEYLDSVIAEYDKDPELAKDIYDTMEYLSDGDYADLAITSESEVAQDKRDTMTVKEILAKVDKMREECE